MSAGRQRIVSGRALLAASIVLVAAGWMGSAPGSAPRTRPLADVARAARPYTTEQEWIVGEIARTIAGAGSLPTRTRTEEPRPISVRWISGPAGDLFTTAAFAITLPTGSSTTIVIDDQVWAPDAYAPLVPAILGTDLRAAPAATPDDATALIEALTEPRVDVILDHEARTTARLRGAPLDPSLHEQAALIAAALAWREAAGPFTDTRPLLCRTTAHLAIARALLGQSGFGPAGRLATAMISTLVGRQADAVAATGDWPDTGPLRAWSVALRLRNTGDWRHARPTTLLERLEYARALCGRVGSTRLLQYLDTLEPDAIADWHRIALDESFSIETGNRFADEGLGLELQEAATVWRRYHAGEGAPGVLMTSLHGEASSGYRILDWNTWAAFLQRQLCAQLVAQSRHLRRLGLERELAAWSRKVTPTFERLQLFPFVLLHAAEGTSAYRNAVAQAHAVQVSRPELITARLSALLRAKSDVAGRPERLPSDVSWFTPHVPTGTAFDLAGRSLQQGCPRPVPIAQVERWAKMSRWDRWTLWALVWLRAPGKPTFNDVNRVLREIVEYDVEAGVLMFHHLDGSHEQYIAVAQRMCRISTDECRHLGAELVTAGRDGEAAEVFERFAQGADDPVALSNSIAWLVRYYWDTGRESRGDELAMQAGETGSAAGLEILGHMLERQRRYAEAEAVFQRLAERYDDSEGPLAAFYLRQAARTGHHDWMARAQRAALDIFPYGFEAVDAAWLPAPPTDGIVFVTFGDRAARTGLRPGDVIVGVDGKRVRSVSQYHVIAAASSDPSMQFVIWRNDRYLRTTARVPQRWFGVHLENHPSPRRTLVK